MAVRESESWTVVTLPRPDARVRLESGKLQMSYGTSFDGELEHWHFDTFRASWRNRSLGRAFATFALDADGKVKGVDVEGIGTFSRKPDAPRARTLTARVDRSPCPAHPAGRHPRGWGASMEVGGTTPRLTAGAIGRAQPYW